MAITFCTLIFYCRKVQATRGLYLFDTICQFYGEVHVVPKLAKKVISCPTILVGQKKRYSKMFSCIACGTQTRAAQANHDQSPVLFLICRLYLPGMLANIHVYILTAVTIFCFLVIYRKFKM